MKYEIIGDNQQMAKIDLQPGEGIFAEAGSMVNMSGNMVMESQLKGGIIAGLKRAVTGDSLFLTRFTSRDGAGFVSFAGTMTGKIFPCQHRAGKDLLPRRARSSAARKRSTLISHLPRNSGPASLAARGSFSSG